MTVGFIRGCRPPSVAVGAAAAADPALETLTLRGQARTLRLYNARGGPVALAAGGDGGWIDPGPGVAEFLAAQGVPGEPLFSTAEIVARAAPPPLVTIHSTQDDALAGPAEPAP